MFSTPHQNRSNNATCDVCVEEALRGGWQSLYLSDIAKFSAIQFGGAAYHQNTQKVRLLPQCLESSLVAAARARTAARNHNRT